ncbi:MAG: DUF692 family protein [Proteobacteria bacterium]|nr:DUF692 family protein [Pseudomonadota bacterium]
MLSRYSCCPRSTRHGGKHLHDLLPLPYDEGVIDHVAQRIQNVQEILGL